MKDIITWECGCNQCNCTNCNCDKDCCKNDFTMGQIPTEKLRVITRRDLKLPYQAVQSGHAGIQFQYEHPEIAKNWYNNSNYLIFLSVENEDELKQLIDKAKQKNIKISIFREPDLNNEITAIAIEPSLKSKKLTSGLKLMK